MTKLTTTHNYSSDITEYSDSELSLLVFNDEALYNRAMKVKDRDDEDTFINELKELFTFTEAQENELREDLRDGESIYE